MGRGEKHSEKKRETRLSGEIRKIGTPSGEGWPAWEGERLVCLQKKKVTRLELKTAGLRCDSTPGLRTSKRPSDTSLGYLRKEKGKTQKTRDLATAPMASSGNREGTSSILERGSL